jgi:hypothetical protein
VAVVIGEVAVFDVVVGNIVDVDVDNGVVVWPDNP